VGTERSRRPRAVPGAAAAVVLGGMLAGAGQAGAAVTQAGPAVTAGTGTTLTAGTGTAVTAGTITTVAGGVGGPAKATTVAVSPCGARFAGGNLYIGDIAAIRQISPATDQLTTPVGTGSTTPLGDAGPATRASLNGSCTATLDPSGNLVVADIFDNRIRVVAAANGTFYGKPMTAGNIYSVAGNGTFGFSGDGGPAASAELRYPQSVAVDGAGNLVITDTHSNRIRVVAATTGTFYGRAMTTGDIYTVAGGGHHLGDGGPATSGQLSTPQSVTTDGAGNLVIDDAFHERIRVVAEKTGTFYGQAMTTGDIYTVAGNGTQGFSGDGGAATSAELNDPNDVVTDAAGNLVIADTANSRIRVVAATTGAFYGQAMTAGRIYTVAGNGTAGFSGTGSPATSAELDEPQGVTVDGSGNLVVADSMNNRVRVVAAGTGTFYTKSMTAGDIYTIAGNGTIQFSWDGGPATAAELLAPEGVAVDKAGNMVLADTNNNQIRVAAASTGTFYGQPMTAGDIYNVAGSGKRAFSGDGGPATSAALRSPYGIATDSAGDLLIADTFNSRARMVAATTGTFFGQAMTAGDIYTIAGNGKVGFAGDGGPATSAKLGNPEGSAADGAGNLVIADTGNNRIRVVGGQHRHVLRAGDDHRRHLHRGRQRQRRVLRRRRPGHQRRAEPSPGRDGRRGRQPGHRGHRQRGDPGGRGPHRHVLRPAHDRRGHLHRRRNRQSGVLRRRRAGHQRHALRSLRRGGGRLGQPDRRRLPQLPGPGGGRDHRHVLRRRDDRRGHLHGGRRRHVRFLRRRRPGHQRRAGLPRCGRGRRHR
jgi:hypothetical protein